MAVTFKTTLLKDSGGNATGISVPPEVIAALGTKKRVAVKATLNGYTYRTTVAPYNGVFMLPVAAEHRDAAGIKAGDEIEVTLAVDEEPRTVEVPDELAAALAQKPGAREAFDRLSYTIRKEHARQVTDAKTPETRQRRIEKIVSQLG